MVRKISVVIPTYKRPELLQRCLHKLHAQTFSRQDYEIIVVSDGPDERTRRIVKEQFPLVKFDQLYQKKGPAAARNLGWLQAGAELIAFTDDDCLPEATWLEEIWNAYNGEELIAFSGKLKVPLSAHPTDYELNAAHLENAEFITANCACTKRALIRTGGFDERFAKAWREDNDLHFQLLSHQIPLIKIDAMVVHPVRKARPGISLKEQRKGLYNALLFKKHPGLYRKKIGLGAPWNYYAIILSFIGLIIAIVMGSYLLINLFLGIWIILNSIFIAKRIWDTKKSAAHVAEMIFTSILIPFLSVFWQIYGSIKFRVLFL